MKKFIDGIQLIKKSIDCCNRLHLEETDDYVAYNMNVAAMYEDLKDSVSAIPYYQAALDSLKKMSIDQKDERILKIEKKLAQ